MSGLSCSPPPSRRRRALFWESIPYDVLYVNVDVWPCGFPHPAIHPHQNADVPPRRKPLENVLRRPQMVDPKCKLRPRLVQRGADFVARTADHAKQAWSGGRMRPGLEGRAIFRVWRKVELKTACDLAKMEVEAVVNAANRSLRRSRGLCEAIFQGAGVSDMEKALKPLAPCPLGGVRLTPGCMVV